MRLLLHLTLLAIAAHLGAPAAHAQSSVTPLELPAAAEPPAGWSFTPALDYALVYDSNVLMENVGSTIVSERLHVLKPRVSFGFVGRRGDLNANYAGALVSHPTLTSLNSYDQRLTVGSTRLLSRRTSISGHYGYQSAPTTELVELVGVPFTRVGSQRHEARAGISTRLSRRTELNTTYRFQNIAFDENLNPLTVLNGGHSHGGTLGLKHALSERFSLTADYFIDHATFLNGSSFAVQNGWAGVEYAIDEATRVYGSAGAAYLGAVDDRPARFGPATQAGISRDVQDATVGVDYTRAYVPSYGFGGTSNNQELRATLRLPLSQRWSTQSALSFRRNEPLEVNGLPLRSMWFHASVGYLLTDWARLEAYTAGSRQHIDRPDGKVNRYTFGIQISAATTTRIR
jgi:hypothetical protein